MMKTMIALALGATALSMTACSSNETAANTEAATNASDNALTEDLTAIDNGEGLSGNATETTNSLDETGLGNEADNATSNAL